MELWSEIFEMALGDVQASDKHQDTTTENEATYFPQDLMDLSIERLQAQIRLSANFALVSSTFRAISERFLYRIFIFRGQSDSLARLRDPSLSDPTREKAAFVHTLIIRQWGYKDKDHIMIDTLYAACVNLQTTIVDMPDLNGPSSLVQALSRIQPSISAVKWLPPLCPHVGPAGWHNVQTLELLISYSVLNWGIYLPLLVTLKTVVPPLFVCRWGFPNLRNLWLIRRDISPGGDRLEWTQFLEDHAAQLDLLVTQVDNMSITANALPTSILSRTTNLRTIFLPLSFNPQAYDLDTSLPHLIRVGVLLPMDPNQLTLRNTSQWWNAFRLKPAFSCVKEIAILHWNAPASFLNAFQNVYGYDKRLRFHRL